MTTKTVIIAASFALMAAGCTHNVRLQADQGGYLTQAEVVSLDTVASATTASESSQISGPALAEYVFAFRPGFDVAKINDLQIKPFIALSKDGQGIAADIPPAVIARSGAGKAIPAASMTTTDAPDAYVLSGAVTRVVEADGSTVPLEFLHETSVAMRLSRNNEVLGVIQVNSVGRQPSPFLLAPSLIFSAFQGSRATWSAAGFKMSSPLCGPATSPVRRLARATSPSCQSSDSGLQWRHWKPCS